MHYESSHDDCPVDIPHDHPGTVEGHEFHGITEFPPGGMVAYDRFIQNRVNEIFSHIKGTLSEHIGARDDFKAWIPQGDVILMNFKDGIGFKVTIELDHAPTTL